MNDAGALGQVFSLPQPFEYAPQQGGGRGRAPGQGEMNDQYFGIPKAEDGLQATGNVANETAGYYQKLAALRQYAQGMWANYQIDVTKPDYSRPEAVAAAEAFKMELANAEATANQAKNSQQMLVAAQGRAGNVIPDSATQGGYYGALTPQEQSIDMNMSDSTKEMVNNYSGQVENSSIMGAEQKQFDAKYNQLVQQAAQTQDPNLKDYLLRQAEMAKQTQNMTLNPPAESSQGYGMDDPNIKLARKYYLLSNGSPEYFKPSGEYNSEGSQIGISTVDKGTKMGDYTDSKGQVRPFVISHYSYDPDSKTLTVHADAPDATPIEVKGNKILNFLSEVAASNSGGILNGKTLRDALGKMKLLGSGDVDINGDRLLSPMEHAANDKNNESLQESKKRVSEIRKNLSTELDALKPMSVGGIAGEDMIHVTPSGKNLTISKKDGKYFFTKTGKVFGNNIVDPKDIGTEVMDGKNPTGEYDIDGVKLTKKEIKEGVGKERMMEILEKLGHTTKRIKEKEQGASDKAQELINKYSQ